MSNPQLKSSLWSRISFWCTHKVPNCLGDWGKFVENYLLLYITYLLVYPLYIANFLSMFMNENMLT